LDLHLRSTSKKKHGDLIVRSIENAEKNPKEIDRWIKSIADLHRTKPPPQVHYTKTMPDIESLMQIWPEEFECLLGKIPLPKAEMDLNLDQYIRIICTLLDIPVYKNVYESLHVLFTLYLEFRSNQHFMNMNMNKNEEAPPPSFYSSEKKTQNMNNNGSNGLLSFEDNDNDNDNDEENEELLRLRK
jgi:intraflagellar transport protein 46